MSFCSLPLVPRSRSADGADPIAASFTPKSPRIATISFCAGSEADSVTASVMAYEDLEGYLDYGNGKTEVVTLPNGTPVAIAVRGLRPNTGYKYRLHFRKPGANHLSSRRNTDFTRSVRRGRLSPSPYRLIPTWMKMYRRKSTRGRSPICRRRRPTF